MTKNENTEQVKEKPAPRPLVYSTVSVTLFCADVVAMSLSLILALFSAIYIKDLILPDIYNKPLSSYTNIDDLFFIWMCPIILFVFYAKGHYTKRVPWWNQVQSVLYICMIAFLIDGFTRFALDMSFSRLLIGFSWVYVFFLTIFFRQITYIISRKRKLWRIPTVIIGDQETVIDTLFAFGTDHYTGYDVKHIYLLDGSEKTFDYEAIPAKYRNIEIHAAPEDYTALFEENLDHYFVITLERIRGEDRDNVINALTQNNALYAVVPPVSRISLFEMEPSYFFGYDIMLLHAKKNRLSPIGSIIKRGMDITLSAIALTLLSPIMLLVAVMLKVEGQGGSVFYGGERIGRKGKRFKCWKFRSMEPDSDHLLETLLDQDPEARQEWETFRKLKRPDPRVTTKTARIIRKLSIDELPQIWNVLIGDMSLVGPRPILDNEVELFGSNIKYYTRVRPGITGLWQVSGRNETSFQRRVYWDGWYVRNWSVWGDIVILIKTLYVVVARDGAY